MFDKNEESKAPLSTKMKTSCLSFRLGVLFHCVSCRPRDTYNKRPSARKSWFPMENEENFHQRKTAVEPRARPRTISFSLRSAFSDGGWLCGNWRWCGSSFAGEIFGLRSVWESFVDLTISDYLFMFRSGFVLLSKLLVNHGNGCWQTQFSSI